jgi:uncharacterized SAM-binding protein YcdF (DUF218 family)
MTARKKKTLWRALMHLLVILIFTGILLFGLALGALCIAETNPPPVSQDSEAVIVLGCQVYPSGEVSPQLELRLEAALDTYRAKPRLIIACGAQGASEPGPEGQIMRDWLISRGIPETDVIAECESRNTRQNLQYAKALLPDTVSQVTIITSDYHLPRAMALARDLGLSADGIGSPCRPEIQHWAKNHVREVLSWGKYLAEKVLGEN